MNSSSEEQTSRFRYTLDNDLLTDEQRQYYEDNGYLVIRNLVPKNELEIYRQRFIDLAEGRIHPPATITMMRDISVVKAGNPKALGESAITKIQSFQDEEVLFKYCETPIILDYVSCFTGPNITAIHTMLINKPPNVGKTGRHPLHQDLYYFPFRPADRIVCAWTAMEKINRDNGCLVVLPGTHRGELLAHTYPDWDAEGGVNAAYHGIKLNTMPERVHLTMEAGDTVFFHPILIHGSGANKTRGYRKAISCHYCSSDCYHIDPKGTSHQEIAAEVEAVTSNRGLQLSYNDIWRFRSRLVRGREGTFTKSG